MYALLHSHSYADLALSYTCNVHVLTKHNDIHRLSKVNDHPVSMASQPLAGNDITCNKFTYQYFVMHIII